MEFQKSLIINVGFMEDIFILYTPEKNFYLNIDKGLSEKIILFCDINSNNYFQKEDFLKISEDKILEKLWKFFIEKGLFFEKLKILSQLKSISRFFDNPSLLKRSEEDEELSYKLFDKSKKELENKSFNFLDLTRKSHRKFNGEKIDLNIIEKIIYDSYFFKKDLHKPCASGGAFYPLKIFYIENDSKKIFEFKGLKFEDILELEIFGKDLYFIFEEKWEKSSGILLIMADLSVLSIKYGYKSLKLAYLEAGYFSQNFYLTAEKVENLGICEFAGVNEQVIYNQEKLKNFLFCSSIIIGKI